LTFEQFCSAEFTTTFEGNEIVGLYLLLLHEEEELDQNQRKALDCLRSVLYENLSVEELEGIGPAYSSLIANRRFK